MGTYIFMNGDTNHVRITIYANTEEDARKMLELKLQDNSSWLDIDTIYNWEVITAY